MSSSRGTVGIKDRGRVLELPSGNDVASGPAGVAPAGRARIRYNSVTSQIELSIEEGSYVQIPTGSGAASPWQQVGTAVSLVDPNVDLVQLDLAGQPAFAPQYVVSQVRSAADGGNSLVLKDTVTRGDPGDTGVTIMERYRHESAGGAETVFGVYFDGLGAGDTINVHIFGELQPIIIETTVDFQTPALSPVRISPSSGVAGFGLAESGSGIELFAGDGNGNGDGANVDMDPGDASGTGADGEVNIVHTRPSVGDQANFELPASFASIVAKDNLTGQAGVGTTYVNIEAWGINGVSLRSTPDQANNQIQVEPGVWKVTLTASVSAPANTRLQVAVFVDGVEQNISASAGIGGTDGYANMSCVGTIQAVASPTTIQGHIKSDVGGGVIVTVENAQLYVERAA